MSQSQYIRGSLFKSCSIVFPFFYVINKGTNNEVIRMIPEQGLEQEVNFRVFLEKVQSPLYQKIQNILKVMKLQYRCCLYST